MMKRTGLLLLAALVLAACGGGTEPSIDMDGKPEVAKGDAVDGKGEVCTPECAGKECGSDDCGGSCGDCHMLLEQCSDEGQCVAFSCESSKDCPGSLVCAKEIGECVACVVDADCGEEEVCGTDFECHEQIPCESDKECKDDGMVCDMDAGECVECLETTDCDDEEYCKEQYCVPDECVAGESHCEESQVVACAEDGSGWDAPQVCGAEQYCEEAACHDYVCTPGTSYCDENVAKVCDPKGSGVANELDCGASGKFCANGACVDCEPLCDGKECGADGCGGSCGECAAGFDCLDHLCVDATPNECEPGESEQGSCGTCGITMRVCGDEGMWGPWSDCAEQGECSPGSVTSEGCPPCRATTCTNQCLWSTECDVCSSNCSAFTDCGLECPLGYHPTAYGCSFSCGDECLTNNQASCAPSCGSSFTKCEIGCPPGYSAMSYDCSFSCGDSCWADNQTTCALN